MEEKERYELVEEDFAYAIVDNEEHKTYQQDCIDFGNICDLLNQQSKRIKELQQQLAEKEKQILEYQEQSIRDNQKFVDAFVSFQQQLKENLIELAKNIVEDIKNELNNIVEVGDYFDTYIDEETPLLKKVDIEKLLDTILKKYGE